MANFHRILIFLYILLTNEVKGRITRSSNYNNHQMSESQAIFLILQKIVQSNVGCEILYLDGSNRTDLVSPNDLDTIKLGEPSSGARALSLFAENVSYARHYDIHRFTPRHCGLGILFFNSFKGVKKIETWLFDTILPRYGPVIRKDEDHFIFVTTTSSVADEVLSSGNFGEKIKYKIALYLQDSQLGKPKQQAVMECKTSDFYANNGGPVLKILQYFEIHDEANIVLNVPSLFPDMTKNFNGKRFRITVPNVKYRFEMEWRDGAFHPKRGFYKWWLDEAIRKFNFTYHMFWSSFEKATGKPLANGTWVGAAGDLLYDRADIAVIVGTTYSRHPFFGFSAVLSYEWVFFMTHKPWSYYSPRAIFWPFTPLMWSLFFVTLLAMTLSLKLITEGGTNPEAKRRKWTYARMFDYIFTTFMEQDREGPVQSSSIRMLCAFWLLFSLVTSNAYRGALVSLIAFPVDTWIPTTFQELAYSNFKVILNNVGKVGAAYDVLSSSTDPVFQTLFNKMEMIGQPELCLMKAMKEDAGCIIWEGITVYANARNVSDRFGYSPMAQSKETVIFIKDGFTYEKRAIFKHHMDRTIDAALQMGLTIKWLQLDQEFIRAERKVWEKSVNKTEVIYDRDEGPQKLILSQFTGLFLIFVGGLVAASGRFLMELWLEKNKRKSSVLDKHEIILVEQEKDFEKSAESKTITIANNSANNLEESSEAMSVHD